MKKYVLFAGVNGAGKSTLFETLNNIKEIPRVNADEIAKNLGAWDNPAVIMESGKRAVAKIKEYFKTECSFSQETTLCGKSILKNIEIAKEKGHGIPEETVEKRYWESFHNLKKVIPSCDLMILYDNTEQFRRFAIYKKGKLVRLSSKVLGWYHNISELN